MSALKSINPATGEMFAEFRALDLSEVKKIVKVCGESQREWTQVSIEDRSKVVSEIAGILRINSSEYAEIITKEMGKPISESIGEIEKCAWLCEYYAENSCEFLSDKYIKSNAVRSFTSFEPLGVILGVMPWNFPFWQVFRFAVPAMIAGNAVLLKHAPNVLGTAMVIEKILHGCGLLKDIFRVLMIDVDIIPDVIADKQVKAVSLTGSEFAGSKVAECSGKNLKKTVLELGGSDPFIVMKDANIDKCVDGAVKGRMLNNGQSCIAAKRFIVHEDIFDEFINGLEKAVEMLVVGDPMEYKTQVGPLARVDILNIISDQVEESVRLGARLITGGYRLDRVGYYYSPTIITDITRDMPIYHQETFGPIFSIFSYKTTDEMISLANDTDFGLGGSIWSKNRDKALSLARKIETGAVFINDFTKSDPRLPFGGIKNSGYGRELSELGIKEFVNIKTISIN